MRAIVHKTSGAILALVPNSGSIDWAGIRPHYTITESDCLLVEGVQEDDRIGFCTHRFNHGEFVRIDASNVPSYKAKVFRPDGSVIALEDLEKL